MYAEIQHFLYYMIWNICKFNFSITLDFLQIAVIPNCSILAAVGQKMASTPGVSATLFNALAKVWRLSYFRSFILSSFYTFNYNYCSMKE